MRKAFSYSSTSKSAVENVFKGRGNDTGTFLEAKLFSNVSRFSASILRSSCRRIISPKTLTSSGSDNHCIPGKRLMTRAKNDIIDRSCAISLATRGCKTLMATDAVGTEGGGSCRITGASDPVGDLVCRFGPR